MRPHLAHAFVAISFGLWTPASGLAAPVIPASLVTPFEDLYYVSDPNGSGDRLVVGRTSNTK